MSMQFTPIELATGLCSHIMLDNPSSKEEIELAFQYGVDPNFRDEIEGVDPAIFTALSTCNARARTMLIAKKIDVNKVNNARVYPISTAVAIGDEDAVRDLLEAGANPHSYSGMNLISDAVEIMSECALLNNSKINYEDPRNQGNNPQLLKELSDFFYIRGIYAYKKKEGTEDEYQMVPFSKKGPFHVYYTGKPEILGMLLNLNVSPSVPVSGTDRSVKNFLRNPRLYAAKAVTSGDGCKKVEFIGAESDYVFTYKFKFYPRIRKKASEEFGIPPVELIVHYDFKPALNSVEAYLESHKETESHIDKISTSLEHKMKDQIIDLKSEEHKKISDLQNSLAEQKKKEEQHEAELSEMRGDRLAAQARKIQVASFAQNEGLNTFYETLKKKAYNKLSASSILDTHLVKRENYSKADLVASGVKTGSGFVPVVGGFAKLAGSGIQKLSDMNEANKHERLVDNIPGPEILPGFCNDIAIEITQYFTDINKLNEKRAKQFAIRVANVAYEKMVEKPLKGDVKKILIDTLKSSISINDRLTILLKAQNKDDQKQQIVQQRQQGLQGQSAQIVQFQNYQQHANGHLTNGIAINGNGHVANGNGKVANTLHATGKVKKDKCVIM